MSHFLIIYDRAAGRLLRQERFDRAADALTARFQAEHAYSDENIEIVALSAESEDDLRRTHARYFLTLDELAARMAR